MSFNENNNKKLEIASNPIQPVLVAMALFIGLMIGGLSMYAIGQVSKGSSPSNNLEGGILGSSDYYDQSYLQNVIDTINSDYLGDTDNLTKDSVTYGLVKGLIDSLDDRYTFFLDPEEAQAYFDNASGDFEGIGVVLAFNGQYTYVESVLKGQPAEEAGLIAGDIILQVDGNDVEDTLPAIVAGQIRGEKGTDVTLTIYRYEENVSKQEEQLDVTITRNKIEIDNITWERLNDNTIIIDIYQFSDVDVTTFINSWDKVVSEIQTEMPNVENIVVDLRGNPGGYVAGVKHILEDFLHDGDVLMGERTKNQDTKTYRDKRDGAFENQNLVVLVNESSASASEIFSAAIQENNRGVVVGEKTVGKGVEQTLEKYSDGSILFLVFQEWLTPDGRRITAENPITPDYEVEYNLDNFKSNTDPQLDKALELLK
ncbi:S41 family peptidase [Candidatus Dojkabacteria bacterium]|uniref:S41 family peptidase n=1 Tax=Candidatus Dojkabacteria bacterium TaxID=2099670 RepID=A0A955IB80_9BACT|nr:S41 family peptidase [Candidatus Dojkabacteria bacterium]